MIHCTACGARTLIDNCETVGQAPIADALNIYTRTRRCTACSGTMHTTELRTTELGELRRQAYLWQRHEASLMRTTTGAPA